MAEAREVSDAMFAAAARALADSVAAEELAEGSLYPSVSRLREVTRAVAIAVAGEAVESGIGRDLAEDRIAREVDEFMWEPEYPVLVPV